MKTFLPYLWGIETDENCVFFCFFHSFYPTYEALKLAFAVFVENIFFRVFTLPMRHWNNLWWKEGKKEERVFTLPMRHWNHTYLVLDNVLLWRFYPTYEALKRYTRTWYSYLCYSVFTLPMRHWNNTGELVGIKYRKGFLPYLWGIETTKIPLLLITRELRFYPTYEALKLYICYW